MKLKIAVLIISLSMVLSISSSSLAGPDGRLKIYCGITMIQAMGEIAKLVEEKCNCRQVKFVKGGSGDLYREMLEKMDGDLYLPGRDSYIERLEKEHPDFILTKEHVGFNQAAIVISRKNPKNIHPVLDSLLNSNYKVIIGDASTGSIGRETKRLLEAEGIYKEILKTAVTTAHSKTLTAAIKTGEADISINWYAVTFWPENEKFLNGVPIVTKHSEKQKLILAILKTSDMPKLSQCFFETAVSEKGRQIFKRFGLY